MKERAQAFNVELEGRSTDQALYDDIVSYLGEYRLLVPKYSYQLKFGGASFEDLHVRNIYNGEPAYESAKRAIAEKKKKGLPIHREVAELVALGDPDNLLETSLSYQLRFAEDGDTITWGSRQGPEEEGFGKYGFMFRGIYHKQGALGGDLGMTAVRIENASLPQYNSALRDLTGTSITFPTTNAMLSHPFVVKRSLGEQETDAILRKHFAFEARGEDQDIFQRVIKDLDPMIREFMQLTKNKTITSAQKLKALNVIEHYALELKDRYKKGRIENVVFLDEDRPYIHLRDLVLVYGDKKLPTVAGSCGAAGETQSNNPLSFSFRNLLKAIFEDNEGDFFKCPKCQYQASGPVGNKCPNPSCGLTKEVYAASGGKAC